MDRSLRPTFLAFQREWEVGLSPGVGHASYVPILCTPPGCVYDQFL